MKMLPVILLTVSLLCCACHHEAKQGEALTPYDAEHITKIETGNTTPDELVNYACSLAGTPYKYGSKDIQQLPMFLTISASGCHVYQPILHRYSMLYP
jgi:hypothetical protein